MPVLHIGDVEIVARTEQLTSPALHIKNAAGEIYHVAVMPLGGGIFDATETLVYEEDTINTCQTVTLPAGIYRVEMRGGTGGKPYRCNSGTGTLNAKSDILSTIFKLNTETVVYSFRGGDGNNSGVINSHGVPGGGASGVDSMLIVGDRTIRANGAVSTRCYNCTVSGFPGGGAGIGRMCQGGAGGIISGQSTNDAGDALATSYGTILCAGGGGGANALGGGVGGTSLSNSSVSGTAGTAATSDGGGDGGDVENLLGTSATKNTATGGAGGANVYYSCGGQVAVSYGGGGGGAMCALRHESSCVVYGARCNSDCSDGGDGGSGSTGTSNDSYIKIYKIG